MAFEAAKCTICGGVLQLDNDLDSWKCDHCGSKIIVREAIQKMKIEVCGNVSMSGISTVENDVQLGLLFLENKEWKRAYEVFCKAIEKNIDCLDAWTGCVAAMTRDFTWADYEWAQLEGSKGIISAISCCYKISNQAQKEAFTANLENLVQSIENHEESTYKNRLASSIRRRKGWRTVLFCIGACISIVVFMEIFREYKNSGFNMGYIQGFFFGLVYIIGALLIIPTPKNLIKFRDATALNYLRQIKAAIQQTGGELYDSRNLYYREF